jgi:hypothetical protein
MSQKFIKTGALLLLLLGILHLMAMLKPMPDDPMLLNLQQSMKQYQIHFLGAHSLFKFHIGFSVMMGFLTIALGLQSFLLAKELAENKRALISLIFISFIACILSIIFFHLLVIAFTFGSALCFGIAYRKRKF